MAWYAVEIHLNCLAEGCRSGHCTKKFGILKAKPESQTHQARESSSEPSTLPNQRRSNILVFMHSLGLLGPPEADGMDEVRIESAIVHH